MFYTAHIEADYKVKVRWLGITFFTRKGTIDKVVDVIPAAMTRHDLPGPFFVEFQLDERKSDESLWLTTYLNLDGLGTNLFTYSTKLLDHPIKLPRVSWRGVEIVGTITISRR